MISRVLITALLLSKSTLSKPTTNAHVIKVTYILKRGLKAERSDFILVLVVLVGVMG